MNSGPGAPPWRRDAGAVLAVALAARLAVVAWAASRIPPAADGAYYHRIAERIASGLGYTWLWPDGVVTYAAHYPVGYPAAVGALYALAGPRPAAAMVLNAALGALAALAVHRLAARAGPRWAAALAGGLVALHPGLVAYTPALMTEGVTAALVTCAAWAAVWAREGGASMEAGEAPPRWRDTLPRFALLGVLVGAATLVRPQSLVLAPAFAWIALLGEAGGPAAAGTTVARRWARRAAPIVVATVSALAVCVPWTARNCVRMNRCALVSVNGGWNLLIGADAASTGAWSPIQVPEACREVFDEAGKDVCFGKEARRFIAERPGAWLSLVPRKLAATFDYCGAAGWYLHDANPEAFRDEHKVALGTVEAVYERVVLLLALAWAARGMGAPWRWVPRSVARLVLFAVGVLAALQVHGWIGYIALLGVALTWGRGLARAPTLALAALAALAATALTHAVFFGAGRYALVVFPLLSGLAALSFARGSERRVAEGPATAPSRPA